MKELENIALTLQPVRLEYAKLSKRLGQLENIWNRISQTEEVAYVDAEEIALENQVSYQNAMKHHL